MIDRDEIQDTSNLLGVDASNVQRDYMYGWVLAGLYGDNTSMHDRLVLKGGNAFRKGYFVNTRFSGDLDFAAPIGLDADRLLSVLNNVCRMIQARTGIEFDLDRNARSDQYSLGSNMTLHKFTLYFQDFDGQVDTMTIALRMDVTEFARIHLPIQRRHLIHPYSDRDECATSIDVVSLEEALADKLKCLLQRNASQDLFDLAYSIFVNDEVTVDKSKIVTTFLRKTIFEPCPKAALELLLAVPFDVMRDYWNKIVCAVDSRMDFTAMVDRLKDEIRKLFSSFDYGEANRLAFFPAELRTPIMEAGQSQTLLRITYDEIERMVEPYSLNFKWRKDGAGQEYLYVWDQTGGVSGPGLKSLFNWKITSLETTNIKFVPRGEIELAKAGEYGSLTTFPATRTASATPTRRLRTTARSRYRVRCNYCQRVFDRTSPSTMIRPHQDGFGNRCPGRRGYRI